MMSSWSEIKKDILPKSVKDSKVTHWLMEQAQRRRHASCRCGPHLCSKQECYQGLDGKKIEQYRKGRDVYVVGVTNVGKSTLINAIIQKSLETRISSRPPLPRDDTGQDRNPIGRWILHLRYTRDYSIATRWLTT